MAFCNLDKMRDFYTEEPMKENVKRLMEFDLFHCLLAAKEDTLEEVKKTLSYMPRAYEQWLTFCNGGLLFDTVLLSTADYDEDTECSFDTYEEWNSSEARSEMGVPLGYEVFAFRSYGDPICFNTAEKDEKVYLWDVENEEFSDIWDSVEDWLIEEIDGGIQLIADEVLEPLDLKLVGDQDE